MKDTEWRSRKVVIVGAGAVGATFAYALARDGVADEIALLDVRREQAEGQVLDLAHGLPFIPSVNIHVGDVHDYSDAHAIVLTAGAKQSPGESRLNLVERNAKIVEGIVGNIVAQNSQAVLVVVSNPVDILTYVALKKCGWSRSRVIGSGTVLDSARCRYLLSRNCGVDVRNVHAYILGEHGDSEMAAWSMTHVAGMPIDKFCPVCESCGNWKEKRAELVQEVRDSAYHIIDYKGATNFAIGLALVRIVGAILRNERSVLTVSTLLEGEYGLIDVCLSVPCLVSRKGIERVIEGSLTSDEMKSLAQSANILRSTLDELQ